MDEPQGLTPNFEASLDELERIVKELEKGDLPLEASLLLFEKGVALSDACKQQLQKAETRVEILTRRDKETIAVPFRGEASAE